MRDAPVMKLSRTDRWVLSNQYRILEALYPAEATDLQKVRQALEEGYELEYGSLIQNIYDDRSTLSETECRFVIDVMSMFDNLRYAYDHLVDKADIDEAGLKFWGFSGNDESRMLGYARYLRSTRRFESLPMDREEFDSHMPTLDMYRRMLDAYNLAPDKLHITKVDIVRTLAARRHR